MNNFVFAIIAAGLMIGSFLNVVIYRSAKGGPIMAGRSKCPKCKKTLKWYELMPVLSFALQKGKCRGCKDKISWQYPIVELLTAGFFVLLWQGYLKTQITLFQNKAALFVFAASFLFLAANLIAIFIYDLLYLEIPINFLLWGLFFSVSTIAVRDINWIVANNNIWQQGIWKIFLQSSLFSGILGALAAGGFFLFLVAISREKWMGQGDIYIGAIVGMLIGWPWILEVLVIAFTAGAIIGILLVLLKNKKFSAKIAFGPFLVVACYITLLWGQDIFNWYIRLLI